MKLTEMYLRNSMAFEVRLRSMADPENKFRGLDQYYVAEGHTSNRTLKRFVIFIA